MTIHELIHTSAERGIRSRGSGFTTVAMSEGMPAALADRLESMSSLDLAALSATPTPHLAVLQHVILRVAGARWHIVSRIAPCGLDYSGRANRIAHHLAIDTPSRMSVSPIALLRAPKVFHAKWEGPPKLLRERPLQTAPALPATRSPTWAAVTGDAGWSAAPLRANRHGQTIVTVVPTEVDPADLIVDSTALLTITEAWTLTFCTAFVAAQPDVECRWRLCRADAPIRPQLVATRGAVTVDLTAPVGACVEDELTVAARNGETVPPRDRGAGLQSIASRSAATDPMPQATVSTAEADSAVGAGATDHAPATASNVPFELAHSRGPGLHRRAIATSPIDGRGDERTRGRDSDAPRNTVLLVAMTVLLIVAVTIVAVLVMQSKSASTVAEADSGVDADEVVEEVALERGVEPDESQDNAPLADIAPPTSADGPPPPVTARETVEPGGADDASDDGPPPTTDPTAESTEPEIEVVGEAPMESVFEPAAALPTTRESVTPVVHRGRFLGYLALDASKSFGGGEGHELWDLDPKTHDPAQDPGTLLGFEWVLADSGVRELRAFPLDEEDAEPTTHFRLDMSKPKWTLERIGRWVTVPQVVREQRFKVVHLGSGDWITLLLRTVEPSVSTLELKESTVHIARSTGVTTVIAPVASREIPADALFAAPPSTGSATRLYSQARLRTTQDVEAGAAIEIEMIGQSDLDRARLLAIAGWLVEQQSVTPSSALQEIVAVPRREEDLIQHVRGLFESIDDDPHAESMHGAEALTSMRRWLTESDDATDGAGARVALIHRQQRLSDAKIIALHLLGLPELLHNRIAHDRDGVPKVRFVVLTHEPYAEPTRPRPQ